MGHRSVFETGAEPGELHWKYHSDPSQPLPHRFYNEPKFLEDSQTISGAWRSYNHPSLIYKACHATLSESDEDFWGVVGALSTRFPPKKSSKTSLEDAQPLECPYSVGAIIHLAQRDRDLQAVITHIYTGDADVTFSNSCTVLLRVLSSSIKGKTDTTEELCNNELVLKIGDSRYTANPRTLYGCKRWNDQLLNELTKLSLDDIVSLKDWLVVDMPDNVRSHPLVARLIEFGTIPDIPTHIDLYGHLMTRPAYEVENFLHAQLVPQFPGVAQKEVFLHTLAEIQLSFENYVAQKIESCVPARMPRTYGIYNVSIDDQTSFSEKLQIQGLLMDKASGRPVACCPHGSIANQQVRLFAQEVVMFQLELRRHNLDIRDGNMYNILLTQHGYGNHSITFVDYGAISLVIPDDTDIPLIRIELPSGSTTQLLDRYHFTRFFDIDIERAQVEFLINHLATSPDVILKDLDSILSCCFESQATIDVERFIWCFVMLQILYSTHKPLLRQHVSEVLQLMQFATHIMIEEQSKASTEPWWSRISNRLALLTKSDKSHTHNIVSFVVDMLGTDYECDDGSLILRLVHDLTGQLQFHTTGSMFPDISQKIISLSLKKNGAWKKVGLQKEIDRSCEDAAE